MGIRMSWCAVANVDRDEAIEILGLHDLREAVAPLASEIAVATLPSGATLFLFNAFWHELVHPAFMSALSAGGLVVGCAEEGGMNASLAFLYRDRREMWSVNHVLDQGADHFDIEGTAPASAKALLAQARAECAREGHDALFDVPGKLAEQFCGYRFGDGAPLQWSRVERRPDRAAWKQATVESLYQFAGDLLREAGFSLKDDSAFSPFTRTSETETIDCRVERAAYDYGVRFSMRFEVRNAFVSRLDAIAMGREADCTLQTTLSDQCGTPEYVYTRRQVEALKARLATEVPALIARLVRIDELDRIANNGRLRFDILNRPTESHFDTRWGLSCITLAWLAGNPAFEEMVAQTDRENYGGPSPNNAVQVLARHLRANVEPLFTRG